MKKRMGMLTTTITNITVTKIYRYDRWYRIYDENLDWDAIEAGWPENYRYNKIQIEDPGGGSPQVRTIYGYSKDGKYWYVYKYDEEDYYIDYLAGVDTDDPCYASDSGWCNTYDNSNPFTYTILTGVPGQVTCPYQSTHTDGDGQLDRIGRYVFDANVDWTAIDDNTFNTNFKNRLLVVLSGNNTDESRRISWRSTDGKYWYVDPAFPKNSNYETTYKIVGDPDDDRYASGGNHPASKLFQAKQALNAFLESNEIKHCAKKDEEGNCIEEEYSLNMGFATYMSARIPRVRAKYYRKIAGSTTTVPEHWTKYGYYTQRRDASDRTYYHPTSDSEFTITTNGLYTAPEDQTDYQEHRTYTGVFNGYKIDRLFEEGACNEQIIHYELIISDAPTDSQPNRHKFVLKSKKDGPPSNGGWDWYGWRSFDAGGSCPDPVTVQGTDGTYTLVPDTHPCYVGHEPYCQYYPEETTTTGDYYTTRYTDNYGNYSETDPEKPRYINKDTLMVTPYKGYCNGSWWCDNPGYRAQHL
jgi:hypothetical protein